MKLIVHHDKKIGGLLLLVVTCLTLACQQQHPTPAASSDGKGPNTSYPTTLADMNGWHGIQVTRSPSNGRINCSVSFPSSFGITADERNLLIYMVAQSVAIRRQTDCWISPNDVYGALNQLLRLVTDRQDHSAARLLLNRGTSGTPFNLDGEVAQEFTESYLIPVLEKFDKLDSVLGKDQEDGIVRSVCSLRVKTEDLKDTALKKRIEMLIMRLRSKGKDRMAHQIETCR